jgi:8-oxo-dGTP pyrophosphatase MutT (NUDIX family)
VKTKDIEAGGGVVFRSKEEGAVSVLLIFRNGVWDIPKGKREKKESREMCARREVMEEVNADALPTIKEELVNTYHTYVQKGKLYNKTTFWFSMEFDDPDQDFTPQTSEGIDKVEWKDLDEAIAMVGYDNLRSVLNDFKSKNRSLLN